MLLRWNVVIADGKSPVGMRDRTELAKTSKCQCFLSSNKIGEDDYKLELIVQSSGDGKILRKIEAPSVAREEVLRLCDTLRAVAAETCFLASGWWTIHPNDIDGNGIAPGAQASLAERFIAWLDKERSEGYNS